jgi:hypothetical protein
VLHFQGGRARRQACLRRDLVVAACSAPAGAIREDFQAELGRPRHGSNCPRSFETLRTGQCDSDIEINCIAAIARAGKSAVRQQRGRRVAWQLLPIRARWDGAV